MRNAWDPAKGASLTTYFVGQCKRQFPNVYRSWHSREQRRRDFPMTVQLGGSLTETLRDPATITVANGAAGTDPRQMDPIVATVIRLKHLEGYTYEEIATMVPEVRNAKAAENMVSREKKRQWSRWSADPAV